MPGPVVVLDVFESKTMEKYLSKTLTIHRQNMVASGMADISWRSDHSITLEHKTVEQALSEMGGRLDDQLRKHSHHADEVGLVIDGIATPVLGEPACYIWHPSKDGKLLVKKQRYLKGGKHEDFKLHVAWETYQAYIWRLDKEGFTVYQAPTEESLCLAISAFVHNSLKPDHKTLRRYNKTKPVIWEEEGTELYWFIRTLMVHTGVAEVTARKLLEAYGTPSNVYTTDRGDSNWPTGGEVIFDTIMKDIGRDI